MRKTNGHHPHSSSNNKKPGLGGRLTIKQRRFVDAYIRNGGNGTGAVFDAGYETESERSAQGIGTREERAAFLTSVYENESHPIGSRLRAVELVCKMYGDFLDKVVIQEKPARMPVLNIIYTDDE